MALATAIARKVHAIRTPPFKVIALDCDDTLWSGICGEDGPQGVVIDAPRRALQEFMAARRAEGMLLALCSKNNEEDVAETFRAHPGMPLKTHGFCGVARELARRRARTWRNWRDELDLGLDSVMLVDDNPKEIDEARAGAPEVLGLALPAKAADVRRISPARVGFRPRARDRGRPATARVVRAAGRTGAGRARRGQPGGVPGGAEAGSADRADGARAGGARGAIDAAHQPDERHLRAAQRGRGGAAFRRVPGGDGERPLRRLRTDRRPDFPGARKRRWSWIRSC